MENANILDSQAFVNVERALEAFRAGKMVIMTDDKDRENEGDLIFPAEDVSADKINFMAKEARGLICLALSPEHVEKLHLPLMSGSADRSSESSGTAFTLSIEAARGVTTGISAGDRAKTVEVAIKDDVQPSDIKVPGHIFPLRAKSGGVLERTGHTEGSVDLARLAGKKSAAVICEIMNDDGSMARLPELKAFAQKHDIPILAIEDLITYRLARESFVKELKRVCFSEEKGITGIWFQSELDQSVHFALVRGAPFGGSSVDVRVHKHSPLADVWGLDPALESQVHSSKWKLDYGFDLVNSHEKAVFLYLGNGDKGSMLDLVQPQTMDPRIYGTGAQILRSLGVQKMRVHLSSDRTLVALSGFGLQIEDSVFMKEGNI